VVGLLFSAVNLFSSEQRFASGPNRVMLLELFTSQGCSSCPPAERWLNTLEDDPRLWKEIVPIAFHVDYWDRLGWPDPYASEANTERQYSYKRSGAVNSVYTPGFVANGKEWRGWFERSRLPSSDGNAGELEVTVADGELEAMYSKIDEDHRLNVAVMGVGLQTKVERGENRNRKLDQSFVVLSHDRHSPKNGAWKIPFPRLRGVAADRLAIAVWVTEKGDLSPIQATGGWIKTDF